MNLFDRFIQTAERQPDHLLVVTARETYSYGEFCHWIETLAKQLRAYGVAPGWCLGLHYPNSPAYISLTYAIWACGACVVPIPTELSPAEKQQIAQRIHLDAVISKADVVDDLNVIQAAPPLPLSDEAVFLPSRVFRAHPPGFAALNPAFVRFSSGTTGTAKGVVLSHETISERIQAANQGLHIGPDDTIVWLLSMAYHFTVSLVAYLTFGATLLLSPNTFGVTIIRMAAKHHATLIYAAPTHYALMTQDRGPQLLPDVRLALVTTTKLPSDVATAFSQRFQQPLHETYGIIEVGLPCINLEHPREKQGSVGRPLPAYDLHLDEQGAIFVRGQGLLDAYYDPWQPRADILAQHGGWFATGDLGEQDPDGYLYLRGRSKEVISVGGMKFFPQEVEAVLELHPAIAAACVFRVPDPRLGDVPHAHIVAVPHTTSLPRADELHTFCATHLAVHKIPTTFRFVSALARNANGKIIRDAAQLITQEGTDA